MDANKYNRSVTLLCPTCGGDQFKYDDESNPVETLECASCNRQFTRDELIEENGENIFEHKEEMKKEITADLAKELRGTFKRAFHGSKYIKFK